jgi:hypothetical protein
VITEARAVFSDTTYGLSVRISTEKYGKKQMEVIVAALCKERGVLYCNKGHITIKMHRIISVSADENKSSAQYGENGQVRTRLVAFNVFNFPQFLDTSGVWLWALSPEFS